MWLILPSIRSYTLVCCAAMLDGLRRDDAIFRQDGNDDIACCVLGRKRCNIERRHIQIEIDKSSGIYRVDDAEVHQQRLLHLRSARARPRVIQVYATCG